MGGEALGDPVVLWTLVAIVGVLCVASFAVAALFWAGRSSDELVQRMQSWWNIVAVVVLAILAGPTATVVLFALISFVALKEYFSMIPARRADRRVLIWAYLAIPLQYFWVGAERYGFFIITVPVYLFVWLPVVMVLIGETKGFLRSVGTFHWGLMACVFSLSHAAFLFALPGMAAAPVTSPALPDHGVSGAALLLFLLIVTEGNDICQYIVGKLFGRVKVVPSVSPGKTREGLIGGALAAIGLSLLLAPFLTPFEGWFAAAIGLLIALGGFLGDITISAVKRDIGVKDAGSVLPGHGGILDRVDSLIFTAPLFFHYTLYFGFSA